MNDTNKTASSEEQVKSIPQDTSINDARWLLSAVVLLGVLVLASGVVAAALGV
ncbi:MAG: hypothetical protein AAF217_13650 [Pseudomonadota bacterium]